MDLIGVIKFYARTKRYIYIYLPILSRTTKHTLKWDICFKINRLMPKEKK